jgi:peroxiredoxin (alkyl hydroperoxide reductase subunit C)
MNSKKKLTWYSFVFNTLVYAVQGESGMAQVGKLAPDFSAEAYVNGAVRRITLSELGNCYKVLFFHPMDFTFVCPTELLALQDKMNAFDQRNTVVLGISVDSVHAHRTWAEQPRREGGINGVTYPLVSDIKKTISRMYGVLDEDAGVAFRGMFILDEKNVIQCCMINNMPLGRNIDEVLRLLDAIQHTQSSGMVCPANWSEGQHDLTPTYEGITAYAQQHMNRKRCEG